MAKPISPDDIQELREKLALEQAKKLPDEVFEVFNRLIAEAGISGRVCASEAADEVAEALGIPRSEVFDRKLLDVEPAYRAEGWDVTFYKTPYYDPDPSFFVFKPRGS